MLTIHTRIIDSTSTIIINTITLPALYEDIVSSSYNYFFYINYNFIIGPRGFPISDSTFNSFKIILFINHIFLIS